MVPADGLPPDFMSGQLGAPYERFSAAERASHVALLNAIAGPDDVAIQVAARGDGEWVVTVCTPDFLGALSLIVGLLTAQNLDVLQADVFTVQIPRLAPRSRSVGLRPGGRRAPPPRRFAPERRLLDVFTVRALAPLGDGVWDQFRGDLARALAVDARDEVRDDVIQRVSQVLALRGNPERKLLPIAVDAINSPGEAATKLSVRSVDTPGFLFAFTNALAGFTVNVERAVIRTVDGETEDTFWVTDGRGGPIVDERQLYELRVATALIKQFTYLLPDSPNPGQAWRQFNALIAQMLTRPEWTTELASLASPDVLLTLASLLGVSRFLWEDFLRLQHESLFPLLVDAPVLERQRTREDLQQELQTRIAESASQADRITALNRFKDHELFRIDLRHIAGRVDFAGFSRELTWLAEVTVEGAAQLAQAELDPKFGRPMLKDSSACPWCICGLGKFGGAELGFGSDLELLFVYASEGLTSGPTSIANSEYFATLVQTFLRALPARQEGIFEVDLRLRPYGQAGSLATSLSGFRSYYRAEGDALPFERLALVRLRPVVGDPSLAGHVVEARNRFVYSTQPFDLTNLRHLRERQAAELVPRGQINAKYSPGGLVDFEYFVQARQIVAGAAAASVRVAAILEGIDRLAQAGYLSNAFASQFREGYGFLRRLIDALRVVRGNARDLTIPAEQSREFVYLTQRLHFATPVDLSATIATWMRFGRGIWEG